MSDLGKILITNGGDYNNDKEYEQLTIVRYNNASWVSKQTTTGNPPSDDSAYWQLVSKDGETVDIISTLDSDSVDVALAASMGKELKGMIDDLSETVNDSAGSEELNNHIEDTASHVSAEDRENWNAAKNHANSAHAPSDATKVEVSVTNGNIKINGSETNVYTHPSYSSAASGLYKVSVDATGHVKTTTVVNKNDIVELGIPGADTHYASKNVVNSSSTDITNTEKKLDNGNVFLINVENGVATSAIKLLGSGSTKVTTDENGNIVISSTDTVKTYNLSDFGINVTAGEINYLDGLTSNVQSQLNGKLGTSGDSKTITTSFTSSDTKDANSVTDVGVLTSGESHASIFAKISQMFKNIRFILKLLGNTDISSIGEGTITSAIATLSNRMEIKYVSQSQYDNLTSEEKEDKTKLYVIE